MVINTDQRQSQRAYLNVMGDQKEEMTRESAMAMAVEAAAASVPARPSESEIKSAVSQAERMLKESDMAAGLKDMQNLTLAIGLPAARVALRQLVDAGNAEGVTKTAMMRIIDRISPITEPGCIQIDFYHKERKAMDTVYLELDSCDRGHDLDSQLGKIKPHVDPTKWTGILQHLSVLIGIGRSVYAKLAHENEHLIHEIRRHLPERDAQVELRTMTADRTNTTLYLIDHLPKRVGIYVRRKGDPIAA
jgi:hypothetical protein